MRPATAAAIELIRRDGLTAYEASKRTGVAQSTIHRALARENQQRCPCCGQIMRGSRALAEIAPDVQKSMVESLSPRTSPATEPD